MADYSSAVIYTITTGDDFYVGGARAFSKRKNRHQRALKNECCSEYHFKVYEKIRENNDNLNMKIYKHFPCNNKLELRKEEQNVMYELKPTLNMVKAYRTKEEEKIYQKFYRDNMLNKEKKRINYITWLENNSEKKKENDKKYYEKNREKILAQVKDYSEKNREKKLASNKNYYEKNREQILAQDKEYRAKNRDEYNAKQRERRERNKDRLNAKAGEKIICECGCEVRRSYISRHKKTDKHKILMNNK